MTTTGMVIHVNDPSLPPERWRYLFDKIGVDFGYRPLATRIGMDHTRLRRLILGGGTSPSAIKAVADAFSVSTEEIHELRGEQAVAHEPFTLPEDAGRLTGDERDVIRSMVRALLNARDSANALPTDPAAPTGTPSQAGEDQEVVTPLRKPKPAALPQAARDIGTESEGRRRRREQDEAAENPGE